MCAFGFLYLLSSQESKLSGELKSDVDDQSSGHMNGIYLGPL